MDKKTIQELFTHMEWADASVWDAAKALQHDVPDDRLRKLLGHIHLTQCAFMDAWKGRPFDFDESSEHASLETAYNSAVAYYEELHEFAESLDESRFDETLVLPWAHYFAKYFGKEPEATTLGDTLLQVGYHTHYHRGQINARIRELGGTPPHVDYIAWVWFGRPMTRIGQLG